MNRIIELLRQGFRSSSGTTPEWKSFVIKFRNDMRKELNKIDAKNFTLNRGHFYVSGFFQVSGQWYYFSISDVRFFPERRIMIRTAEHNHDYTGGKNTYAIIKTNMFVDYFNRLNNGSIYEVSN